MTEGDEQGGPPLLERLRGLFGPDGGHDDGCPDVDDVSCREAVERVYEYLDDELDEETAERIRCHVETCKRCYPMYNWEKLFLDVVQESCGRPEPNPRLRRKVEDLLEREAGGR